MGRAVRGLLFGLTPHDPGSLAVAIALIGSVAFLGTYGGARRAAAIDPAATLQHE